MKVIVHKALFYTLLFCVYGIFFSVESFYNFEGQPNVKADFRCSAVKSTPLHVSASYGFRLNKRYQQEDIPPCPINSPAAPERCIELVRFGSPWDGALPAVAIIHYSLRGPPAAA
jgi:hypothetical protein